MGYKKHVELKAPTDIKLGGKDKNGKPNPTSIEGYYLGVIETESKLGPGKLHIFQTKNGNVGVWGKTNSNRILLSKYIGMMCTLAFTGMGKPTPGKQPAYNYELSYDPDNTVDVSGLTTPQEAMDQDSDTENYDVEGDDFQAQDNLDEEPPVRAAPPRQAASTPSAAQQARVQALLNGGKVGRNRVA